MFVEVVTIMLYVLLEIDLKFRGCPVCVETRRRRSALCPCSEIRGHKASEYMLHANVGCAWVVHSDHLIQMHPLVQS